MKPNDMIILGIGLVVLYFIWKRVHTVAAPTAAVTASTRALNPLSLAASAANAAIGAVGSVASHLNPLSWGGDSAATKQRKEIQRQNAALKAAPTNYAPANAAMVAMGRPDLQVDNSAYTNYLASQGIDERAYYIP